MTAGTEAGVILGTAAYMSPEQARGKPLDKRTDVFSFGCVLFECLTGRQAFRGETVSDTLAAILKSEPDRSALPPETPDGSGASCGAASRRTRRAASTTSPTRGSRSRRRSLSRRPQRRRPRRAPAPTGEAFAWGAAGLLAGALAAFLADVP